VVIRDQLYAIRLNRFREAQGQIQNLSSDLAELESVRRKLSLCVARGWTATAAGLVHTRRRAWASWSEPKNSTSMAITSLPLLQELAQLGCVELGLPNVPLDLGQLRRQLVQPALEALQVDLQRDDRCNARRAGLCLKF